MTELIAFEDAEALTIQHLASVVTDAHVSSDVPSPIPALLVTVERAGGSRQDLVTDAPLLIIQAWASTKPDAYDLIKVVRAHVHAMRGAYINGVQVYRVTEAAGPAFLPDPDTNSPRYQITVQLRLRGNPL